MTTPDSAPEAMAQWPNGRLLSTAARLVEHAWVQALDSLGLTHAGLIVLHLLAGGALSQTELARQARVQTQTMSRTLDRLEREGLIVRIRDEHDARRHVVTRTDAGVEVWQQARHLERDIFPPLENADELRAALLQIIAASSAKRW
ncbi:MAG: MarR family transcriptional regulator [Cryobacterium sp.]